MVVKPWILYTEDALDLSRDVFLLAGAYFLQCTVHVDAVSRSHVKSLRWIQAPCCIVIP